VSCFVLSDIFVFGGYLAYGRFLERQLILTAGQVGHVTGG